MLLLMSVYYEFVSPYYKGDGAATKENSWLWGSAFVAWLIKKLIVKYGGMNTYKHAKPFFIGLVIGSVFAVFAWNVTDLTCSIMAEQPRIQGASSICSPTNRRSHRDSIDMNRRPHFPMRTGLLMALAIVTALCPYRAADAGRNEDLVKRLNPAQRRQPGKLTRPAAVPFTGLFTKR